MALAVALLKTGEAASMALPGDIGGERLFSRELPKRRSCAESELVLFRISPPTLNNVNVDDDRIGLGLECGCT